MPSIIPAILTRDPEEVAEKIRFLETIPEITDVHIDFADGKFVPNSTCLPQSLKEIKTRLRLEAHLMTWKPQDYLHDLQVNGFWRVIFHFESYPLSRDLLIALSNARVLDLSPGAAINPRTELNMVDGFADHIDMVQVMGVEPGFQGKEFIQETLERLQSLRNQEKNVTIQADGGINLDNFQTIIAHGAERLVVGSGIWQTPDARQTIDEFISRLEASPGSV